MSAEVLTNEKSEGCHLPDITLSECWATTTLGKGAVKSPCRSVKTSLKWNEYFLKNPKPDVDVEATAFYERTRRQSVDDLNEMMHQDGCDLEILASQVQEMMKEQDQRYKDEQ